MKAGLVIRSCAFRSRYTEASETKYWRWSTNETANSRGDNSGALSASYRLGDRSGELIPHPPWRRTAILETFREACSIAIVPAIEGGPRDPELRQGAPHRQRRLLDQPDDLQLLGGRVPHVSDSPSPSTLFLSTRFSIISSANSSLSW